MFAGARVKREQRSIYLSAARSEIFNAVLAARIAAGDWNRGREAYAIQPGDRIAQLVVMPIVRATLRVVDTFEQSGRGAGGFGHTGLR